MAALRERSLGRQSRRRARLPIGPCAGGQYSQPRMSEPEIAVVVCTRNRPDSLGRTLESLSAQTHPRFEVIVVDQSEEDRTRHVVEGLEPIEAAFAADPEVLLLYGQVTLPPEVGSDGEQGGATPILHIADRTVLGRGRPFRMFGMGANIAARRQVFQLVGPCDEVLGGGGPLFGAWKYEISNMDHCVMQGVEVVDSLPLGHPETTWRPEQPSLGGIRLQPGEGATVVR